MHLPAMDPISKISQSQPQDRWAMQFYDENTTTQIKDGDKETDGGDESRNNQEDREAMFEKPLTPSDVGKLNRLVIPKQQAERFFPLDSESGEKGLQLSFEDESGKVWRFRYSYWNSSQSYVLTKGWSRFVKEKRLDAGDVVYFDRVRPDGDRFYIGWRRRPAEPVRESASVGPSVAGLWGPLFYPAHPPYPAPPDGTCAQGETGEGKSPAPAPAQAMSKRLRLFGVNLDCPTDGLSEPNGSCWSSKGRTDPIFYQGVQFNGSSSKT